MKREQHIKEHSEAGELAAKAGDVPSWMGHQAHTAQLMYLPEGSDVAIGPEGSYIVVEPVKTDEAPKRASARKKTKRKTRR